MTEIREKYLGKQIVIVGDQIIAVYDDLEEAYLETIKTYTPGTFMIHDVPEDIEDEIIHLSPFGLSEHPVAGRTAQDKSFAHYPSC